MSPTLLITMAVFVGVAALVAALSMFLRSPNEQAVHDRLEMLTGAAPKKQPQRHTVLAEPLDDRPSWFETYLARLFDIELLLEQAASPLTVTQFMLVTAGMAFGGTVIALVGRAPFVLVPAATVVAAAVPLVWVRMRRRKRFKHFGSQMPDAMELLARALRSGHSLASGFHLVATEMSEPIAGEFHRAYEEQNLGLSLDDALDGMVERVPNLDLKFFATAVVLQRQTGGDLSEILEKIGHLVRERFRIWGQIQALTGEGRLSGVVLLALPPLLLGVTYYLNPDYISLLFTDPMGRKMLAGAAVMQVAGAVVIKKIINIKV
jgi:tight adherence protein B